MFNVEFNIYIYIVEVNMEFLQTAGILLVVEITTRWRYSVRIERIL